VKLVLDACRVATRGIEARQGAARDRLLDAVADLLAEGGAAHQVRLGIVGAAGPQQREAEAGLELGHHVAVGRQAARVLERRLEQLHRARRVTAVERQLAQELAGQHLLALSTRLAGELERTAIALLGALVLAAPAAQHPDREQRCGFARHVAGVARDLERLAEMLFGQIPQPQSVADQTQVLMVEPHPGVQPGALVELQRLFEEAGRFTPLAQVLVDQTEVVERGDQPVAVVDAAEGRGGVLQPLDRLGVLSQPRTAQPAHHRNATHGPVVV